MLIVIVMTTMLACDSLNDMTWQRTLVDLLRAATHRWACIKSPNPDLIESIQNSSYCESAQCGKFFFNRMHVCECMWIVHTDAYEYLQSAGV